MLTRFLAILLGITTVVAMQNVTYYSQKSVAREMDSLGASVLVLPKSITLQDYYSADMPCRQEREWLAVLGHQAAFVLAHLDSRQTFRCE
jgi:hypothetical protein